MKASVGAVISARRNRETGTLVTVERTGPGSWIEQEPGWMTLCDEHSTCCLHETRALALAHAAQPSGWCELCYELVNGKAA